MADILDVSKTRKTEIVALGGMKTPTVFQMHPSKGLIVTAI
jgi:hypothetical protein